MPKLNQKGLVHFLLPIILVLGLIAAVYLVTSGNSLKLFSKASVSKPVGPEISFTLAGPKSCVGLTCLMPRRPKLQEEFGVNVYARSDIEAANLFTARIKFPKDLVEVKEIRKEGSFVTNWAEEYYDNETGEIDLSGGVPDPGYKTETGKESGLMATIVFRAKALGKGTVAFTDSSAIYSNLNNIDILTIKRNYDLSVEIVPTPTSTPAPPPAGRSIKVTYPNGGEVLKTGDTVRLAWNSNKIDKVMIGYSFGSGSLNWITNNGPVANTNFYDWKVNIGNTANAKVKIEIIGYETGVGSLSDQSDDFFTVSNSQSVDKGDGNKDGKINLTDMSVQHTDWKPSDSYKKTIRIGIDMNNDGYVNAFDFSALRGLLQQLGVIKVKK